MNQRLEIAHDVYIHFPRVEKRSLKEVILCLIELDTRLTSENAQNVYVYMESADYDVVVRWDELETDQAMELRIAKDKAKINELEAEFKANRLKKLNMMKAEIAELQKEFGNEIN